ncbi:MAG: hypothetical protein HY064_14400 [Bacteroidetes bacterium]|nr:hypothetical protein [Bacteroidota bacterium]
MMKKKINAGDIFSIAISNGKFIAGRILLNVHKQCINSDLLDDDSVFVFYGSSILIEIFKGLYDQPVTQKQEVLIKGFFVDTLGIEDDLWKITGYQYPTPDELDFPENLIRTPNKIYFSKGEIKIPTSLDRTDFEKINTYPSIISSYAVADIGLHYLGLDKLIDPKFIKSADLTKMDLRFNESQRESIFEILDEDKNLSYHAMATKHGYDISRFY